MGVPLFHLRGTSLPTQAEGAMGPGALRMRMPEQGCVGGKACHGGAAEWWELWEGPAPVPGCWGRILLFSC